ncbi:hypothetical protein Q4493_13665 [Colwellia sp. 1_MG-2023]|uniref:hypothetical protein n=1 Tax=Colwellia sp. 1_MG-2023 TaxID=3062649 RepID=UPI0026E34355|nr:hypothetical protein [Colwellia sp. 1_MG-2023]MDO6446822.1 hypothetical protein [Colwellia sp. 1_MG-2023]
MIWLDKVVVPSPSFLELCLIITLLLVTIIVVYRAKQRLFNLSPVKFFLVFIANVVSFIAVSLLVLPIQIKNLETNQVMLLTTGFEQAKKSNNALCDQYSNIYYLNETTINTALNTAVDLAKSCNKNLVAINHLSELSIFEPKLDHLAVYGDGLTKQQWQQLEFLTSEYHSSELLTGFISPQWLKEAVLGESITFSAKLQLAQSQPQSQSQKEPKKKITQSALHLVQLIDVNGAVLAEQNVRHHEVFSFRFTPKTMGKHIYRLRLMEKSAGKTQDNKVLVDEAIPVNITVSSVPRVLIVQSSPNYESKYFKHWLTENSGQLLTITQISKNHVTSESINLPEETAIAIQDATKKAGKLTSLNEFITSDVLAYFDLLMIDSKALLTLKNEQHNIIDKVSKNGLGVLVFADEALMTANTAQTLPVLSMFQAKAINNHFNESLEQKQKQVFLHWRNNQSEQKTKHAITANHLNLQDFKAKTLVYDQQKQALVITNSNGKGNVALTSVNGSFQLKTNGLVHEYSKFWQFITTSLARNKTPLYWIPESDNKLAFSGQQLTRCWLAERSLMQSAKMNHVIASKKTPLYIEAEGENKYCSVYFSKVGGWQTLTLTHEENTAKVFDKSHVIYHFTQDDWLAWQQTLKHFASENIAKQNQTNTKRDSETFTDVNKLIIFFVLLLSSIFLWIERKLF